MIDLDIKIDVGSEFKAKKRGGKTTAVYPARPFMRPALEKVQGQFAASYAGSFGK